MWEVVLVVFFLFLILIYYFSIRKYDYWKKKKVSYLQPVPLFGNYSNFIRLKTSIGNVTTQIYKKFPNEPYVGVFYGTEPTLLVQDPDLLKLILVKDFYYFNGREVSKYAGKEFVTKSIFFNYGDHWKVVRHHLTKMFSTAKMKNMFPLIEEYTHSLDKLLEHEIKISNVIETNKLMARFTTDCVGSCAFGIEMNLLQIDSGNNPYGKVGNLIFGTTDLRGYKNIFRAIWPKLFYGLGFLSFPKEVNKLMASLVTNVFKLRQYKPSSRNDFIDLILSLQQDEYIVGDSMSNVKTNESKRVKVRVDDDLMIGQSIAIFGGAFETSATTLTLTLFEIAKHKEVQLKVQEEIDKYLSHRHGRIGYDCVTELPYLIACVDETLRLHPVFTVITREVMEDYTFPCGLSLDKGVRIHIPVYYMHRNPENFPEPEVFRPERFLGEEIGNIKPFTYLPFGIGPRICIGMRFSRMQVLAGLVTVLKNYNVQLADGMSSTIDFDPRWLVSHTINDVNLKYIPRRN